MPLLIAGAGLMAGGVLLIRADRDDVGGLPDRELSGVRHRHGHGERADHELRGVRDAPGASRVAAGIASTSRQVGQVLGVAVMGSVLTANLHGPLASGFAAATRPGWWIIAACGFAVIVLALITTGQRGRASAAKTATLVATAEEAAEKVPAALASASDIA